jgi:hypothetical protein
MNNHFLRFLLAAGLLALLVPAALMAADKGMMPAAKMDKMPAGAMMMPAADGQALMDHITKTDPYAKWDLMPGTTKMRQGKEPHGALQNVYVNKAAMKAFKDKAGALPDGAIVVKENYMPDKKLGAVTVMFKKKGYNPEGGDYMWLKYGADMKIQAEGKVDGCIKCHATAKANDYIVLAPLK